MFGTDGRYAVETVAAGCGLVTLSRDGAAIARFVRDPSGSVVYWFIAGPALPPGVMACEPRFSDGLRDAMEGVMAICRGEGL